ncbi:hypothetical protein [Pseudomonas sp. ML96]|uniref:hypothetical protein n=1 Tax=Pseudomonas sp. ML96 TaxID=1523503 RepID=UPI0005B96670|nr:hypothetical protein [Pseudomonas sp. ML96]
MWTKTGKQLLKEFWIPGLIAAAWTTYVVWGAAITVEKVLAALGPSFFLASWLTGQVFRVRKQAGVESGLQSLERRLSGLVEKIEGDTRELLNHMTGGDSFCYMSVMADNRNWMVVHMGDHHLQNLSARVCDLDVPDTPNWMQAANTHVTVGTLFKGMCSINSLTKSLTGQHRRFNIFYSASNGTFTQELRLKDVGGDRWAMATRVFRDGPGELLYERIDPNFPLEADGTPGY